jgi:hypothetical protein
MWRKIHVLVCKALTLAPFTIFFFDFWSLQQDEPVIFSKEKTRRMRERERVEGGREIERERETHWHQR